MSSTIAGSVAASLARDRAAGRPVAGSELPSRVAAEVPLSESWEAHDRRSFIGNVVRHDRVASDSRRRRVSTGRVALLSTVEEDSDGSSGDRLHTGFADFESYFASTPATRMLDPARPQSFRGARPGADARVKKAALHRHSLTSITETDDEPEPEDGWKQGSPPEAQPGPHLPARRDSPAAAAAAAAAGLRGGGPLHGPAFETSPVVAPMAPSPRTDSRALPSLLAVGEDSITELLNGAASLGGGTSSRPGTGVARAQAFPARSAVASTYPRGITPINTVPSASSPPSRARLGVADASARRTSTLASAGAAATGGTSAAAVGASPLTAHGQASARGSATAGAGLGSPPNAPVLTSKGRKATEGIDMFSFD